MRVCIVGASGKLGIYMLEHALDRGYDVVGVCRQQSVGKLQAYRERIEIVPGATNDPAVIGRAVAGCDGVLGVLAPWGMHHYASGTAQAVLDHAPPGRASGVLVRLVAPSGRPGRLLVEGQGAGQGPGAARPAGPRGRPRRPARSRPARVR